jgi:hypothetical protein
MHNAGDSGGPVFSQNPDGSLVLVATISWGKGCARYDAHHRFQIYQFISYDYILLRYSAIYPGVNARVSAYIDFIDEAICQLSDYPPSYCDSGDVFYAPGSSASNATGTHNGAAASASRHTAASLANYTDGSVTGSIVSAHDAAEMTAGNNSAAFKAEASVSNDDDKAENGTADINSTDARLDGSLDTDAQNVTASDLLVSDMATNDAMSILRMDTNSTDLSGYSVINDEMENVTVGADFDVDTNSTIDGVANAIDDASLGIDSLNVTSNDTLVSDMVTNNAIPLSNGNSNNTDIYTVSNLYDSSDQSSVLSVSQPSISPRSSPALSSANSPVEATSYPTAVSPSAAPIRYVLDITPPADETTVPSAVSRQLLVIGAMAVAFVLLLTCVFKLRKSLMKSDEPSKVLEEGNVIEKPDIEKPNVSEDAKTDEKDSATAAEDGRTTMVDPTAKDDDGIPTEVDSQPDMDDGPTQGVATLADTVDEPSDIVEANIVTGK